MGSGFSKKKKQARSMQKQYDAMRDEMEQKRVEGQSGNGLVSITINGEKELKNISIKPECVDPEDVEGLQDLIIAATEEAYKKLDEELSKATSSFSSPSAFPF